MGECGTDPIVRLLEEGEFFYTLAETTLLRELTFSHLENGMVGIRVSFLLGQKADFFGSENLHLKKDGILKGKYVFFPTINFTGASC